MNSVRDILQLRPQTQDFGSSAARDSKVEANSSTVPTGSSLSLRGPPLPASGAHIHWVQNPKLPESRPPGRIGAVVPKFDLLQPGGGGPRGGFHLYRVAMIILVAEAILFCIVAALLLRYCRSDSRQGEQTPEKVALQYDVLVIGAGCAACALVATLVKGGKRVLLIEAGREDAHRHASVAKSANWWGAAWGGDPTSHRYTTMPQAGLGNRRLVYPRGKGAGGTGNVNASIWCRGRREDYAAVHPPHSTP